MTIKLLGGWKIDMILSLQNPFRWQVMAIKEEWQYGKSLPIDCDCMTLNPNMGNTFFEYPIRAGKDMDGK